MIHPKRLLEGEGTEIERLLLKSGRAARPSRRAKWRTGALFFLMGIGTVSKAQAVALLGAKARAWTLAHWLALGVGASAAGWVAVHAKTDVAPAAAIAVADPAGHRPPTGRSRDESPLAVAEPLPAALSSNGVEAIAPPSPVPARLPVQALAGARAKQRAISMTGSPLGEPPAERSIANEIEELDRAREALGTGEAKRAIDRLNRYDRLFPRGTLREEALRLRIEAVVTTGDRATARSLAQRFQALYPDSTHSDRLKALVREP
jgi:hypothetical protein